MTQLCFVVSHIESTPLAQRALQNLKLRPPFRLRLWIGLIRQGSRCACKWVITKSSRLRKSSHLNILDNAQPQVLTYAHATSCFENRLSCLIYQMKAVSESSPATTSRRLIMRGSWKPGRLGQRWVEIMEGSVKPGQVRSKPAVSLRLGRKVGYLCCLRIHCIRLRAVPSARPACAFVMQFVGNPLLLEGRPFCSSGGGSSDCFRSVLAILSWC